MNSKKALENWYNTQSPKTKAYEYEQHYRIIKKDLEFLEILKKQFIIEFGCKDWGKYITIVSKDDYLENHGTIACSFLTNKNQIEFLKDYFKENK